MSSDLLSDILTGGGATTVPLWLSGQPYRTHGDQRECRAPATGELLATCLQASPEDVDKAVATAAAAQPGWGRMSISDRAAALLEVATRIEARVDELALLDAKATGVPIRTMRAGALKGAAYLRQCAGVALEVRGRTIPASADGWHFTFPRPFGVVVGITAYNHPTLFACQKLGPALLAGNSVVIKPGDQTPLSAVALAALTEEVLPPGVLTVVPGDGSTAQRLVQHPAVGAVTFTGSVATGLKVQAAAAASGTFKKLVLELGGKNPMLVFPDADLEAAARSVVHGTNFTRNQGQSCGAISRLIVHRSAEEELMDRILALVAEIRLGLPEDEKTEMGCLIDSAHRDFVRGHVEQAVHEGARLRAGGTAPLDRPDLERGPYLLPTILDEVPSWSQVARVELFGPVLAVLSAAGEDEMLEVANASELGLAGSIWTQEMDRILRLVDRLDVGYVWVNDVETRYPGVPFGGFKLSGIGVEQALIEEVLTFSRTKSVNIRPQR